MHDHNHHAPDPAWSGLPFFVSLRLWPSPLPPVHTAQLSSTSHTPPNCTAVNFQAWLLYATPSLLGLTKLLKISFLVLCVLNEVQGLSGAGGPALYTAVCFNEAYCCVIRWVPCWVFLDPTLCGGSGRALQFLYWILWWALQRLLVFSDIWAPWTCLVHTDFWNPPSYLCSLSCLWNCRFNKYTCNLELRS